MALNPWNTVIGVNLTGQSLCTRAAARIFKQRGVVASVSQAAVKIICMSSVHQQIPWTGHANYAASKGGVMLLMKSIAQAAVWLASDAADDVTGATLFVDGGMTLYPGFATER